MLSLPTHKVFTTYILIIFVLMGCSTQSQKEGAETEIPTDYIVKQNLNGQDIEFQNFEMNEEELRRSYQLTTENIEEEIQTIIKITAKRDNITFENTFWAYDDIQDLLYMLLARFSFIKSTSKDKNVRKVTSELELKLEELNIDINAREDIYKALKKAEKVILKREGKKLANVDKKLISETLLDFQRMGFGLNKKKRLKAKKLFKEISRLSNEGMKNISSSNNDPIYFAKKELEGLSEDQLKVLEFDSKRGKYILRSGVQFQVKMILESAKREETRKKTYGAFEDLAKENESIMGEVFQKRAQLARTLGYKNWSDYQLEVLMIKNSQNAKRFIQDLSRRIEDKFQEELRTLEALKRGETKDKFAKLNAWDVGYYKRIYQEEFFKVDEDELKSYFTLDSTLIGMMKIYEKLFGINIEYVKAPITLDEEITTLKLTDQKDGRLLGIIYLDLYPRPEHEKYGHFANLTTRLGRINRDGTYRHPITHLMCNFPKPVGNTPSLLSFYHVKTLFHEFGHALHAVLTESPYSRFSGTSVARDFVEAPSQMLENWVKNKEVLDTFAVHYQTKKKIPKEMVEGLLQVENSTIALFYRRQFALAEIDGTLHRQSPIDKLNVYDVVHDLSKKYYLPEIEGTNMVNRFGHLIGGYDSKYYGYAYADSVAADMASIFQSSKKGFLDEELGMRLRKEIYSKGSTRDENASIEKFLGRKQSLDSFVKRLLGKNSRF